MQATTQVSYGLVEETKKMESKKPEDNQKPDSSRESGTARAASNGLIFVLSWKFPEKVRAGLIEEKNDLLVPY